MGGWFMIWAPHGTSSASIVSLVLPSWVLLVLFTLLWLLSIFLLLVFEVEGVLAFDMADTITNVIFDAIANAEHCLHGGTMSRHSPR